MILFGKCYYDFELALLNFLLSTKLGKSYQRVAMSCVLMKYSHNVAECENIYFLLFHAHRTLDYHFYI